MNDSFYQFEIPADEREIIKALAREEGPPPEFAGMLDASLAQSLPTFHPFVLGALMSMVEAARETVPVTWKNLMILRAHFRSESGMTVRELPDGIVEITAPGVLIRRKKAEWE